MNLGAFSLSLAVKDLDASRALYEKLGFRVVGGEPAQHWLVLRSGTTTLGLSHGMIEKHTLTFNPGWDAEAQNPDPFTDARELQKELRSQGLKLDAEADEAEQGPGFVMLTDPDENPILIDQHR